MKELFFDMLDDLSARPFLLLSLCGVFWWPDADSFLIVVGMGISDNTLKFFVNLIAELRGMLFGSIGEINIHVCISTRDDL